MTVNIYPSNLQWVGLARESIYGTAIAAPTVWIPVDGSSLKYKPLVNVLKDQAFRGQMSATYAAVPGMTHATLDYKCGIYLDSVYQHFLAALGRADAVTGVGDPWTHKTSLENGAGNAMAQPPSYTLFWFDGVTCVQMAGCVATSVKLDVKVDELASITPSWMGLLGAQISPPANTPTTQLPMPSWNSTIALAGVTASQFSEISLEYKRDADAVNTIAAQQAPQRILSAGFSVTGTMTSVYQGAAADAVYTDYLSNTQPSLVITVSPVGDATHFVKLQHTKVVIDGVDPQGSNKWMEIGGTVEAVANATDALDSKTSPAQVQLASPQSAAF